MTLNDLIKTAEVKQEWLLSTPQSGQAQFRQPQQPTQPASQPKAQNLDQVNSHGFTNSTYTIPGANATQEEKANWTKLRKQDLSRNRPGMQFDESNKYLWDADAANAYISEQQRKMQEGSSYSRWRFLNPVNWFTGGLYDDSKTKELANKKIEYDPVLFNAQKAQAQGLGNQARQDTAAIAHDSAVAASYSPYFMPEIVDATFNGRSWQDARDVSMLTQEYADDLRNAGYTDDQIRQRVEDMGYFFGNDTALGRTGRFAQDFIREGAFRSSLLNFAMGPAMKGVSVALKPVGTVATKIPGVKAVTGAMGRVGTKAMAGAPKFVQKGGEVAKAMGGSLARDAVVQGGIGIGTQGLMLAGEHSDGALHDTLMAMGLNSNRMNEVRNRELYGTEGAFNNYGMSTWLYDQDGNVMRGENGEYLTNESRNPADYPTYVQWAKTNGVQDLQSPEAQKAYINWYMSNGAVDSTIVYTPMFQNLSSADQAAAMSLLLKNRVLFKNKSFTTLNQLDKSNASMLDFALKHDNDGTMHVILTDLLSGASSDAFAQFISQGSGGSGSGANLDELYRSIGDGIIARSLSDPDRVVEDINNMVKLKSAQSSGGAVNKEGANAIASAYVKILADPTTINQMSTKEVMNLAETLVPYAAGNGSGMDSLGPNGQAVVNMIKENIQGRMWDAALDDPLHNLPRIAALWLSSKGMTGIAEAAKNPFIFFASAVALLGGGVLLAGNVFDSDEDDDIEDPDAEYAEALRSNPYA